jgi:hypothetical protein
VQHWLSDSRVFIFNQTDVYSGDAEFKPLYNYQHGDFDSFLITPRHYFKNAMTASPTFLSYVRLPGFQHRNMGQTSQLSGHGLLPQ